VIEAVIIAYIAIAGVIGALAAIAALSAMRRARRSRTHAGDRPRSSQGLTILLPVQDAEEGVIEAVERLARLHHPRHEVIVVNNGSADGTMRALTSALDLERIAETHTGSLAAKRVNGVHQSEARPGIFVIDKVRGTHADTINSGLNLAAYQLCCVLNVHERLHPSIVTAATGSFEREPDQIALGAAMMPSSAGTLLNALPRIWHARVAPARGSLRSYLQSFVLLEDDVAFFRWGETMTVGGFMASDPANVDLAMRVRLTMRRTGEPCRVNLLPEPAGEAPTISPRQVARWWGE